MDKYHPNLRKAHSLKNKGHVLFKFGKMSCHEKKCNYGRCKAVGEGGT